MATWSFLKDNWSDIAPRIGSMGISRLVEATGALPHEMRNDVEKFFSENPVAEAQRALRQALEALSLRRELVEREAAPLGEWLKNTAQASATD